MADYKEIITGTLSGIVGKVKGAAESGAVRNAYEHGTSRARGYSQLARTVFEVNGDKEKLKHVFCEPGKVFFVLGKDAPDEVFAPLLEQANTISQRIAEKEEYIRTIRSEINAAHGGEAAEADAETADFEEVVSATEVVSVSAEPPIGETEE